MSNRTKWVAAALALAVAGTGTLALADEGGHHRFHGRGPGFFRGLRALDLTDDQKAALKTIIQEERQASQPQREQIRAVREQIRTLLDGGKADPAEVGRLTIQAHTLGAQLREQHKRAFERFEAQLTPDQKAKLDQMRQEREQRGPGRRGPRPDRDAGDDEPGSAS
jgi:Spy/CpxP family protein refolding chaperone